MPLFLSIIAIYSERKLFVNQESIQSEAMQKSIEPRYCQWRTLGMSNSIQRPSMPDVNFNATRSRLPPLNLRNIGGNYSKLLENEYIKQRIMFNKQ